MWSRPRSWPGLLDEQSYLADRATRHGGLPRAADGPPAAARRRGGRRQDRTGQDPGRGARAPLIRLQCYEGLDACAGALRLGLRPPAPAPEGGRGGGGVTDAARLEGEVYDRRFLIARPLLRAIETQPRGAAHRRGRPGRRWSSRRSCWRCSPTSRSPSPSSARSAPQTAAGGRADVQSHPRGARRPQTTLPLPLAGRTPPSTGRWRSCAGGCPSVSEILAEQVAHGDGAAPRRPT